MSRRTTRQRRTHGPAAVDYQLAENAYPQDRRRSETRVIDTFGRADQGAPEALRRLAQSLLRVANAERLERSARPFPPDVGIDALEQVSAQGVLYAARALWEEWGIGPRLREPLPQAGGDAPHETAVLAMTATRRAGPASQWACDDHGLADDVQGPEAKALALAHLDRALACLRRHREALEQALCVRTAELFKAEVDLSFWDTTTLSCELDADDDDGEPWPPHDSPAWRQRGHHHEGREGNPQVVVGLALTRDGLPVRAWGLPGKTAEVSTRDALTADVRGWRLHRAVGVGASGLCSEANRPRRSRALGRYSLAVPRRTVTAVPLAVLTRAGRYRHVAPNLRGKEVYVGEGERRRRDVVCHNPDEAAREQAPREHLLELVRAELAAREVRQADPPKTAGARLASRRFGRYLRLAAGGRRSLDITQVAAAATYAGTCVVTTHAATLEAEAVALGSTRMLVSDGCFRRMKTTGRQTHPIDPWRPHRILAPVPLCVLALRRPRAAEIRCQQTWRTIRQTLDPCKVVRYRRQAKTMLQSTRVTAPLAEIRQTLGIPLPKKILDVSDEARIPLQASIQASQTPWVSS